MAKTSKFDHITIRFTRNSLVEYEAAVHDALHRMKKGMTENEILADDNIADLADLARILSSALNANARRRAEAKTA